MPAGYDYGGKLRIPPAGLPPARTAASLAAPLHVPVGGEAGIAFRQQDRPDHRGRRQRVGPEAGRHLLALQRDHARRLEEAVDSGALGLHPSTLRHGPAAHKGAAAAPQRESAPRAAPSDGAVRPPSPRRPASRSGTGRAGRGLPPGWLHFRHPRGDVAGGLGRLRDGGQVEVR